MSRVPSPERLARLSIRHPWLVIASWAGLLIIAIGAAVTIGGSLTTSAENYVATESKTGDDLIRDRLQGSLPGREIVVVQSDRRTVDDPAFEALVRDLTERLRSLPDSVANATNAYEAPGQVPVSRDGRTTLIPVTLTGEEDDAESRALPVIDLARSVDGQEGFTVVSGGDGSAARAFTETSEQDLQAAEIFGIPVALVILMIVFGALVAAGLPLMLGVVSIALAVAISLVIARFFGLSIFVVNFVTTMGMAVGIDYALFVIKRFREERMNGLDRDAAIERAGGTATRAVLFSGLAVIVALFGMVLVPQSIFRSLGFGAILVVASAVAAALTLLPAVLRLLGDRVNALAVRVPRRRSKGTAASRRSFWDRTTAIVMRHAVIGVVASVGLLVAAASPYFTVQLGWAGVSSLPENTEARRAFDILNTEFSAGLLSPTEIVVDSPNVDAPAVTGAIEGLTASLAADSRFGTPTVETNEARNLAVVSVPLLGDPQGKEARDAVRLLRDDLIPHQFRGVPGSVHVTGATAEGIDNTGVIDSYTVPVFAFVLGFSFLILLVVFRSVVVPLKAIIMNLLSVGAAYGLMVLVFQHGVGAGLLGFSQVETIESWVPLFMFAVLFGLSMDYHVFLLSRIREHFNHTGDNTEAVAYGVRTTAGVITGAAAIMIAVFAGFATGQMVMFQQMGFGLAVAVFLDATVVRSVLVPASMALLGTANWYLPSWLEWLPRVDVEGQAVDRETGRTRAPALPHGVELATES